jgi:hypothetical protein
MSYRLTLRNDSPLPSVVFNQPLNAELMGAGFQKLSESRYHALRWPRVQKLHLDRSWTEALSGLEYLTACLTALGHVDRDNTTFAAQRQAGLEASLTRVVCAHHLSGTDIVDLSPVKPRTSLVIKSESPSPRKPLRATKSLPEPKRHKHTALNFGGTTTTKRFEDSPTKGERVLKISRRRSFPRVHTSRRLTKTSSGLLPALNISTVPRSGTLDWTGL